MSSKNEYAYLLEFSSISSLTVKHHTIVIFFEIKENQFCQKPFASKVKV